MKQGPLLQLQGVAQLGQDYVDGTAVAASTELLLPPAVPHASTLDAVVVLDQLQQILHAGRLAKLHGRGTGKAPYGVLARILACSGSCALDGTSWGIPWKFESWSGSPHQPL